MNRTIEGPGEPLTRSSEPIRDPASEPVNRLSRRAFLERSLLAAGAALSPVSLPAAPAGRAPAPAFIQTVLGAHPADRFGRALVHEHVLCDFVGADQTGRPRWDVDEVVRTMLPYLKQLQERGFTGFIDCTPAYIGRDPRVLRRLAEATGLHIVTNTGYYGGAGDKFVPRHAYDESPDQLADRWVREWEEGIEETGVKPGFMKIGVDEAKGKPPALSNIDAKIVTASARASRRTGLSVTCHTGGGAAGLAAARRFVAEGGAPARFIVAHSDGHGLPINQEVAKLGAWVSFDALSRKPLEQHLTLVSAMLEEHSGRLLLSHDNGWFEAGKPGGGNVRDYNFIADTFLPALRQRGVNEAILRKLTVENPAKAFAVSGRS